MKRISGDGMRVPGPPDYMAVAGALLVYRRAMSRIVLPVLLVAVLLTAAVLPILGCSHNEVDIHDKLGSRLMALVDAEKRGEAESFAQSRLIDLVDGSVRVSIKCVSGQFGAAIKVAADLGTVEFISERSEQVQALIPITSLTALAKEKSIKRIREPIKVETMTDG